MSKEKDISEEHQEFLEAINSVSEHSEKLANIIMGYVVLKGKEVERLKKENEFFNQLSIVRAEEIRKLLAEKKEFLSLFQKAIKELSKKTFPLIKVSLVNEAIKQCFEFKRQKK